MLAERRDRPWPLVGLGLAAAALIALLAASTIWPAAGAGWVLVLLAGLVILWTIRRKARGRRSRRVLTVLRRCSRHRRRRDRAVAVAFAWFDVSLADGVGDRVETPASVQALQSTYKLGVGDLRVDLSQVGPISQETHVKASVGVGELPHHRPPERLGGSDAHAKVGDVYVLRQHDDGRNASVRTAGDGLLVVDARVGAGRIDVVRAGG